MRRGTGVQDSGWNQDMIYDMEAGHNDKIDRLRSTTDRIREIAMVMGEELKDQNQMIDGIDKDMSTARAALEKAMAHARRLAAQAGSRHMCYLLLFVLGFFFMLWRML
eukprot:TRINITY_DN7028_c0_g1_i1.p1 TRINITY_DN7028_c0_g1~~TRINITY_DN7028_c0_g1_i1.p1  ORF type:complete len:108 (+),score=30.39 TRINITY_DN7028_c0_g1_i1:217-540(+)